MLSFAAQRKNLQFISDIAPDIERDCVVLGDPGRVRQIITNLLTNSIKFTHQGFVKLSVTKEKETDDIVEVRFSVQDTGIGIDDVIRKRLFQPFSQGDASTARKFGGTGLGLTICKSLLELMHGRMTLDSVVNQGTTATFWVPFNKTNEAQPSNLVKILPLPDRLQSEMSVSCNSSELDQHGAGPNGDLMGSPLDKGKSPTKLRASILPDEEDLSADERSKIHVLVVEDNAINQQIATKTIQKLGFQVSAAWNGREALDYLAASKDGKSRKPDIILMDVQVSYFPPFFPFPFLFSLFITITLWRLVEPERLSSSSGLFHFFSARPVSETRQMPICDGYKATHLLRHHGPYKAFIRDVPIVAMTASAIQGDQEKCRKAGMDDYLAKPVRSKTLEKMLVRWCLNKRMVPTPQLSSAGASICSDESDNCTNAGIPCVGVDDDDENAPAGPTWVESEQEAARSSLLTPKPKALDKPPLFPSPVVNETPAQPPSPPSPDVQIRRVETDELAQQSRDDKLIDAAGGLAVTPLAHTPIMEKGDSLTEANVEKLQREEMRRRMS